MILMIDSYPPGFKTLGIRTSLGRAEQLADEYLKRGIEVTVVREMVASTRWKLSPQFIYAVGYSDLD